MGKLVRKKPVINIPDEPKQAARINTGNVIKDVARVGIGKSSTRKPARKPLYHAKKKAVPRKVLVNRRRIIAAKKRKSSNNN